MINFLTGISQILTQAFFIIIGITGVGFLIAFHELGHFLFCKLFKIGTPSFSIGFGPRIFKKKIGDTVFALSAIPFGGYVEIAGAHEVGQGEQKEAHRTDQYSFIVKPYYQKLLVMLGGILFNLIFAYTTFTLLFLAGIPKSPLLYPKNATPVIATVIPQSPAEHAGLKIKDKIISINDHPINDNAEVLFNEIDKASGNTTTIVIERENQQLPISVDLGCRNTGKPILGALYEFGDITPRSFGDAIKEGIKTTNKLIVNTFAAFKGMFARKTMEGIGGPLRIIRETIKSAEQGIKIFFLLLALISVNLAVLNIFPLPILDGGQLLFYTIEAIIRRQLPEKAKLYIYYVCWIAILILVIYLSINDILLMFKPIV